MGIYRTHTLFEIIYFILFAATSCWFYPVKKSWSKHKRQEVSQRVVLEIISLIWTTFKSNFSLHLNWALNIPGFLKKNAENLESIRCCIASIVVCKTKLFGLKKEKRNFQKKNNFALNPFAAIPLLLENHSFYNFRTERSEGFLFSTHINTVSRSSSRRARLFHEYFLPIAPLQHLKLELSNHQILGKLP